MLGQGALHVLEDDVGVEAGAVRPAVEHADHRQRVGIADAGGEVPFAGDGEDSYNFV